MPLLALGKQLLSIHRLKLTVMPLRQIHAKIGLTSASQRLCRSYYSADGKKLPKEMESAMTFDDGGESFKDRMRRALGPSIDAKTNSNNSMSTAVLPDMIMAQQQSAVVTNLASATTPPA